MNYLTRRSRNPRWAEPLREEVRANAERLASEAGLEIEFIRRLKAFRKEDRIQEILAARGDHPGLAHIFSAMAGCSSYRPWYDKARGTTLFKPTTGKRLHYSFYCIDEQFGLRYLRVPTWAPFRLQVYFNGHGWLARQLTQAGIALEIADNAFLTTADPAEAQRLADGLDATTRHRHLDRWAQRFCPVLGHFPSGVHWSFMQVEYATDGRVPPTGDLPTLVRGHRAHRCACHQGRARRQLPRPQAHHQRSRRDWQRRTRLQARAPAQIDLQPA